MRVGAAFWFLLALTLSYIVLYPVVWLVATSLRRAGAGLPLGRIPLLDALLPMPRTLPGRAEETTYWLLLFRTKYLTFLRNSLVVAASTVSLAIAVGTPAGYALSRFRFPGRNKILWFFILLNSMPGLITFIPLYRLLVHYDRALRTLGFPRGTVLGLGGLVLVYLAGAIPYTCWFLKTFFDTIPRDVDEQALIDGAGYTTIFFRIILPLSAPGVATVGALIFIGVWNEFMLASLLAVNENHYTLPVFIIQLRNEQYASTYGGVPAFAAASLMASIPVIALFAVAHRYLRAGLTMGSVKG